jgi:FKBP-type peptidyl-prolyl cis-trans isomerase FklB
MGVALTIALACTTTVNANTQPATQIQATAVNMSQVSYIMGYGMGKMLTTEKLKLNTADFKAGYHAAQNGQPDKSMLKNKNYIIGFNLSNKFKMAQVNVQLGQFINGVQDAASGKASSINKANAEVAMKAFEQDKIKQYQVAMLNNEKSSSAYLAKIQQQSGVKTLTKGLYYKVITQGDGKIPTATDTVSVNYEGSLPNGQVFDSSYKRGQPTSFQVNKVIPGWTKALEKMPVGSTWELYIAPQLAYGAQAPAIIGPNQALTFKVNLLKIEKPAS